MRYLSTYEMLTPIIAAIDKTIYIDSITDNTLFNYTIYTCKTQWATLGFPITINDNEYTIKSFVPNVSMTVQGTVALSLDTASFELYSPIFYHGTLVATEDDLTKKIDGALLTWDRLPMIWLHEPVDEQIDENELKAIGMRSKCELYFMIDSQFAAWANQDHYTYAIIPMRNLIAAFMASIRRATTLNTNLLDSSHPIDLPKFGSYTGRDRKETTVFSRPMSGCRFDLEIPFLKLKDLCC